MSGPVLNGPDTRDPAIRDAGTRNLRRRQAIGLLWLALLVLLFSAWRAGVHAIFLPRWWRLW